VNTQPADVLGVKAAADEVAMVRLRRVLAHHFGEVPLLEAHLALLDSRGVLYATHAAESWSDQGPETFFGLVRHVVRTQSNGPAPDPDVEGWLRGGRPTHDRGLGEAWDLLNLSRYTTDPLPPTPRLAQVDPTLERFDQILRDWPAHPATFATSYCRLEWVLEARGIVLPPIGY
jgi:hypothetical protein